MVEDSITIVSILLKSPVTGEALKIQDIKAVAGNPGWTEIFVANDNEKWVHRLTTEEV